MIDLRRRAFIFGASTAVVVPKRTWYVMTKREVTIYPVQWEIGTVEESQKWLSEMMHIHIQELLNGYAKISLPYSPTSTDMDRWAQLNPPPS